MARQVLDFRILFSITLKNISAFDKKKLTGIYLSRVKGELLVANQLRLFERICVM